MTDRERIAQLERRLLIEAMAVNDALDYIAALRVDQAVKVLTQACARLRATTGSAIDARAA